MPPLSLTQSKYALATFPIVVKSTPGISMSRPSILIGAPVAFLPVPLPQTDFVADAVPEPTAGAVGAPTAQAARLSAPTLLAAIARPSLIFVDPIRSLLASRFDGLNHWASVAAAAAPPRITVSSSAPSWSRFLRGARSAPAVATVGLAVRGEHVPDTRPLS